jgi:hypothetical protein
MRNGFFATVLATGILMASAQCVLAQDQAAPAAPAASSGPCTQQTVDFFGKAEGIEYRYWMLRLQKAVKEDDRKQVAEFILYPMVWNRKDGTVQIKNRGEFLKNYDEIFTAELKGKIATQNVKCLPGDDEGASVGGGELRYSKFANGNQFLITSISQPGINKSEKLPWE